MVWVVRKEGACGYHLSGSVYYSSKYDFRWGGGGGGEGGCVRVCCNGVPSVEG